MASVTASDIQEVYGEQTPALNATKQSQLATIANSLTDTVFAGRVATLSEIEADENYFARYLGAHLWTLAEGGEVQSSSQTGGSVNYQHLQTNVESSLGETRFGRTCLLMTREGASTGIAVSRF